MREAGHGGARGMELILLLLAINTLNMLDRNLPFILAEAIKADLDLTDKEIGLLGGLVFAVVYSVGGLPLGRLADRGLARQTVAAAVALWSAMTALGGTAQNFLHLAAARLGVAAGEAALAPAAHSIISTHFPPDRRATMIALFSIGTPVGFMLGLAFGGWLVEHAGWRMAFLAIGVPGLVLGAIAWFRLPRRPAESTHDESMGAVLRYLLARPSFRHTLAAASLYSFVGYSLNTFLPAFVMRSHGLGAAETGLFLGLITGVAGLIGLPLSGWLADRLAARDPGWRLRIPALLMGASAPFLLAALLASDWLATLALLFVPLMLTYAYLGPTFSAMHAIVPPHMRATATSCLLGGLTLFGASLGPLAVGTASDWLGALQGRHALATALLMLPAVLALSAWQFAAAAERLAADLHREEGGDAAVEAPQ